MSSDWLTSKLAEKLFSEEQALLTKYSSYIDKKDLLVVGRQQFCLLTGSFDNILATPDFLSLPGRRILQTRMDKIAIQQETIEVVYLPHSLSESNNPHEILREVYRVLKPEGVLILTFLNPFSFVRLATCSNLLLRSHYSKLNLLSLLQLKDWLSLLGFEIFTYEPYYYALPVTFNITCNLPFIKWLNKYVNIPVLNLAYMIVACKRVSTLTPIPIIIQEEKIPDAILEV